MFLTGQCTIPRNEAAGKSIISCLVTNPDVIDRVYSTGEIA
jgi:hypothetical protein